MLDIVASNKDYSGLLQPHDDYFTLQHYAGKVSLKTSSETQRLQVGTKRYFRANDIFGWRAPGHFFLPNEFQKWSKFVPLIGQKNFY